MRIHSVAVLLAAFLMLAGCSQKGAGATTLVAGKTVYAGMGIEGATVTALAGNATIDETVSTYHGSFILHLPPGSYTLKGVALVPSGVDELEVSGEVTGLVVGSKRLDRITISMDGETTDD